MYADVIDPVTKVLREILKIALQFDRAKEERASLRTVLRKLLVIREMHTTYFISVTGTQGAGKTRLMRELYDLGDWLEDNAGRGERRPLFILEADCQQPYACGVDDEGNETQIDQGTLTNELRSFSVGERFLLLRLYVPRRHFSSGFGFLLLPGYERLNRSNSLWQEEMRDTLKHAMGSILVTDSSRMADYTTKDILKDLMTGCFHGRHPVIAISRTEGKTDGECGELCQTAAELCDVAADQQNRIICTGAGEAYRDKWLPQLLEALSSYSRVPDEIHHQRLDDLRKVVEVELEAAVNLLESLVEEAGTRARGQDYLLEEIMKKFRQSADKYRKRYADKLREHSDWYVSQAIHAARDAYADEEEGLRNKLRNVKDFFLLKSSDEEKRFLERINRHWMGHQGRTPLDITYLALTDMSRNHLQLSYDGGATPDAQWLLQARQEEQGPGRLLGYESKSGTTALFKQKIDPQQLQKSVTLLLNDSRRDLAILDRAATDSREVSTALELLPALAMEYLRLSQGVVLAARPTQMLSASELASFSAEQLVEQIKGSLPALAETTQQVIKTVLAITAVDLAIDGSLDVATVAAGGAATGLGGTLSLAAAGVITLAFVGYKTAQAVHQYDVEKKNFIAVSIRTFADQQIEKTLQVYDEIIERLEERLSGNLSLAYGIDKEQFTERDMLARALYALSTSRRDLEAEIDRVQSRYLA